MDRNHLKLLGWVLMAVAVSFLILGINRLTGDSTNPGKFWFGLWMALLVYHIGRGVLGTRSKYEFLDPTMQDLAESFRQRLKKKTINLILILGLIVLFTAF